MSHPLIWPSKYFFYPIGNTSAVSLTMDLSPEEPARILLLGCGDARNVLYTVFTEPPKSGRLLDFTCCDIDPAVLARNTLLFTMIADNHPEAAIWDIFFHFRLNARSHTLLIEQCKKLIDLSETPLKWREGPYGGTIKMCTDYTLSEIKRHWTLYVDMPNLPAQRIKTINERFVTQARDSANRRLSSSATRSLGPLIAQSSIIAESLCNYWKNGTMYTDGKNIAEASILNPTFVYSIAGEGCAVHYGTDPLIPFHLAPVFGNARNTLTLSDVVKAVKTQFSEWCSSYRIALSSATSAPPIVRLFLGEATAVCHAIRVFENSGALNPGIPVAQWKTQLIHLSSWEYVNAPRNLAPTHFNSIHTSNLEDHIGLLNVLIPAVPLLSPGPSSVLYTESLLFLGNDATKEFIEHLHADITVVGLLFGICPVDYLCGFTTRSNTHELLLARISAEGSKKGKKSKQPAPSLKDISFGQFQQLVTWKHPSSGDPIAANLNVLPPTYDPQHMEVFFYDLYQSLFGQETAMNFWSRNAGSGASQLKAFAASNMAHYTREAFVLFLKLVKDRLQPSELEWAATASQFNTRLLNGWDRTNMETLHYQDLCGQLQRYGLFRARSFDPRARKIGPFAAWKAVPDLIRIVLVVPRHELSVLESSKAEEVGTPPLHCDIHGMQCLNLFTSVHAAFGRAISVGTKAEPQVVFEEDVEGWKGKSSLVLSFTAPSYLITELDDPRNLSVGFCVKNTPQACATLIRKLGMELRIFKAKIMGDDGLVYVLPEPMLPARRRKAQPGAASQVPLSATMANQIPGRIMMQIGEAGRPAMQFDEPCEFVSTLGVKVDVTDETAVQTLCSEGSPVIPQVEQISACVMRVRLPPPEGASPSDERVQDVVFPFPVMGSQSRLRFARKSRFIEVLVPTSRSFMPDGMKLNPYPIIRGSANNDSTNALSLFPWSIHRVNLLKMPAITFNPNSDKDVKNLETWLNPHVGSMMSSRERSLRRKHKHDALMFVKDTIHSIFVAASGIQTLTKDASASKGSATKPKFRRLFALVDEATNNCDTILFVNDLRYDLASHTVVCDGYVLPLTKAFLSSPGIQNPFNKLVQQGELMSIPVFEGEMQGWKQLWPCFVERCRTTWAHLSSTCEYARGNIPLSEEMEQIPICSCGRGKDVDGMDKVALWKPFTPYVTRVAISPLFAVSYLERVGKKPKGAGSGGSQKCTVCGKGKSGGGLKTCAGCKKVWYCSTECQKRDWKTHKPKCKT